jgi:hypothetical protein
MGGIAFVGTAGDMDLLKTGRSSGGTYIEIDNHYILIDPGPGCITRAGQMSVDLSKIDTVLISGNSLLNANDINAIAELSKNNNPTLLCHKEVLNHENSCLTKDHASIFKILPVEDSVVHTINGMQIKAIKDRKKEFSFIISTSKYILGYVSDTVIYKKTIQEFANCNILIIKCQEPDKQILFELIRDTEPELVILTGFDSAMIKEDPLELSRSLKRALQTANGKAMQIIPAKDGMIINPESYNIKLKQKSLQGFM